jgi:hypothetical protein
MSRNSLVASFALVGVVATLSAQATSSNGDVNQKTIQSIRVKVIGCVAGGSEAGQYRLTDAVLTGDDIPSTAGTVGKAGSGQDVSFENSPSFDLIGGCLKAHVGKQGRSHRHHQRYEIEQPRFAQFGHRLCRRLRKRR